MAGTSAADGCAAAVAGEGAGARNERCDGRRGLSAIRGGMLLGRRVGTHAGSGGDSAEAAHELRGEVPSFQDVAHFQLAPSCNAIFRTR